MSLEDVCEDFFTKLNAGNWEQLEALLHEDFAFYGPSPQAIPLFFWKNLQQIFQSACPDWSYDVAALRTEGEDVVARVGISATQTGEIHIPMLGVGPFPATGARITMPEAEVRIGFKDGKIAKFDASQLFQGDVAGLGALLKQFGMG